MAIIGLSFAGILFQRILKFLRIHECFDRATPAPYIAEYIVYSKLVNFENTVLNGQW